MKKLILAVIISAFSTPVFAAIKFTNVTSISTADTNVTATMQEAFVLRFPAHTNFPTWRQKLEAYSALVLSNEYRAIYREGRQRRVNATSDAAATSVVDNVDGLLE